MYSTNELNEQRQAMLIKKIEYLREEKKLAEMSIGDIKLRQAVVFDIVSTIRRCGTELGGHLLDVISSPVERSSEASAINTGSKGGC